MISLLDTSVLIEFLRPKGDVLAKRFVADMLRHRTARYTCPSYYECLAGARPHEKPALLDMFRFCERILFAPEDWASAAGTNQILRENSVTVPPLDIMIWTVAQRSKLPLATVDRHFAAVNSIASNPVELVFFG